MTMPRSYGRSSAGAAALGLEGGARWRIQPAAEIRPLQIHMAVRRRAVQQQGRGKSRPCRASACASACRVQGLVHRVARTGMGQLEGELRVRRLADAGMPERDAGGRELAQRLPGIGDRRLGWRRVCG
jgi:hypothetical protein